MNDQHHTQGARIRLDGLDLQTRTEIAGVIREHAERLDYERRLEPDVDAQHALHDETNALNDLADRLTGRRSTSTVYVHVRHAVLIARRLDAKADRTYSLATYVLEQFAARKAELAGWTG